LKIPNTNDSIVPDSQSKLEKEVCKMSNDDNRTAAAKESSSDEESPKPSFGEKSAIFVSILPNQFGTKVTLGKRSKNYLTEGLHIKTPFFQVIETWSMDFGPDHDFRARFTSKDGLTIEVAGSIQYRPDPTIVVRERHPRAGHLVFPTMKSAVIKKGIDDKVANIIASIGGRYKGEAFIEMRAELADLINTVLRIHKPIHMNHDTAMCGLAGCAYPEGVIPTDQQLEFYREHVEKVKQFLEEEPSKLEDNSETELLYGIDIGTCELAEIDFDEETKKALAEGKQSELREKPFNDVLEGIVQLKNLGYGAEAAGSLAAGIKLGTDNFPQTTQVVQISGLTEVTKAVAEVLTTLLKKP
jgi:regulator of protease activity HflC (stomatin/prohibitin superfamily)